MSIICLVYLSHANDSLFEFIICRPKGVIRMGNREMGMGIGDGAVYFLCLIYDN